MNPSPTPSPPPTHGLRRGLYLVLGVIFLALAVLGAVLPVLPCTPFVLLASASFVRSSPRLHHWLLSSRWFGPMLRDWHRYRGVRRRVKGVAVALIFVTISATLYFGNLTWPLLILLIILALTGIVVVLRLPTVPTSSESGVPVSEPPIPLATCPPNRVRSGE